MTKIYIHPPDGAAAEEFTLTADEAIVAGRDPDLTAGPAGAGAPAPTRRLVVPSPLISSNHVMVWRDRDGLHVRDLESKNGTYLGLAGGVDVSLRGPREAHLFLAAPRPSVRPAAPKPISVADGDVDGFAHRLQDAVTAWLAEGGARPMVQVVRMDPQSGDDAATADDEHRFQIPLLDGLRLEINDDDMERTRVRWDSFKAAIYPYVYDQIAAFRACRVARVGRPLAYRSPVAERVLREVLDAARARLPLVITGESGTGKTELAAIYGGRDALRPGRGGPLAGAGGDPAFVTVHCAHLEPSLAHSLLFGALKGSYTSAHRSIVGAVKLADGGTLFLDDVDALPVETQAKLLRFLDHGEYEPLGHGERAPLVANVRVVTGTNADLRAAVRARRFREDLYWRLHSGAVVRVPPLRERPEDVEHLLREFPAGSTWGVPAGAPPLDRGVSPSGRRRGSTAPTATVFDCLAPAAVTFLLHHHAWRGNFREGLRFCARVAMEPAGRGPLDRQRCEEILAETALDDLTLEPAAARPEIAPRGSAGGTVFERALQEATAWWMAAEGAAPERFDQLSEFCESYLKSAFVAHALGLSDAAARPETFDRVARQRLGCDLSTVKRKIDDYLALRASRDADGGGDG